MISVPAAEGQYEPPLLEGWGAGLLDDFSMPSFARSAWRIVRHGRGYDPALARMSRGLSLGVVRHPDGPFRRGGIQLGSSEAGGRGLHDFQASVCCRFPEAVGVGGEIRIVPFVGRASPALTMEPVGPAKNALRITARSRGGKPPAVMAQQVDMTEWHVLTVRRVGPSWRVWIDGNELPLPLAFVQHENAEPISVGLSATIGGAAGAPDENTPQLYSALFAWVRISTPVF